MEDQTPQNPELHRRNKSSIRRKPLHDDNARTLGNEEENRPPTSESSAPASNEDSETIIRAMINSLWMCLNTPIVANTFFALLFVQSITSILVHKQAAINATKDREYMALLVVVNRLTNRVNHLTEKIEAIAQSLE